MFTRSRSSAFTLVELMASVAVITMLMLMLVQMSKSTGETWKKSMTKAEQFREARRAFEVVTRRLASATLNTYWDYSYGQSSSSTSATAAPTGYTRQSELRFRSLRMQNVSPASGYHPTHGVFFQSPTGSTDIDDSYWKRVYTNTADTAAIGHLDGMLNTWGYFLEVGDTTTDMPAFLAKDAKPRYRCRLMEFREDTTKLSVYKIANDVAKDTWFTSSLSKTGSDRPVHVVAENIIAMVLLPRLSAVDEKTRRNNNKIPADLRLLTSSFDYDSKKSNNYDREKISDDALPNQINPFNQLPPVVQVAMFALDQDSAQRLASSAGNPKTLDLDTILLGLFTKAEDLEAHDSIKGDLATLEDRLRERHLNYRLFVSNVSIRGARWSASQASQ